MTIVCGTDFSEDADSAIRVAGSIAKRLAMPLELVHVVDSPDAEESARAPVQTRLQAQAAELSAELGIEVDALVDSGVADEKLVALAADSGARLLVVAALGAGRQRHWPVGSVAERVVRASPVPVLVVRAGAGIEAWGRGERALRVMIGVELTPPSRAALRWARKLREGGPCELFVVQIVWPPEEQGHAGSTMPMPLDHLRPELELPLVRELTEWAGEQPGPGETSFMVKAGWGRVDRHLTLLAAELKVDLLVVGAHRLAPIARLWHGSVSRGVLHDAGMSVLCVPHGDPAAEGDASVYR